MANPLNRRIESGEEVVLQKQYLGDGPDDNDVERRVFVCEGMGWGTYAEYEGSAMGGHMKVDPARAWIRAESHMIDVEATEAWQKAHPRAKPV